MINWKSVLGARDTGVPGESTVSFVMKIGVTTVQLTSLCIDIGQDKGARDTGEIWDSIDLKLSRTILVVPLRLQSLAPASASCLEQCDGICLDGYARYRFAVESMTI
jgi:hypothetical protein